MCILRISQFTYNTKKSLQTKCLTNGFQCIPLRVNSLHSKLILDIMWTLVLCFNSFQGLLTCPMRLLRSHSGFLCLTYYNML